MKLNLNGVEIEVPSNAKVEVSDDRKKVCIRLPEPEVAEKIRVVEVPGPERIRVVEVPTFCHLQHYPSYPTYPSYPIPSTPWIYTSTAGQNTLYDGHTVTCNNAEGGDLQFVNGTVGGLFGSGDFQATSGYVSITN